MSDNFSPAISAGTEEMIRMTPAAAAEIKRLMAREENSAEVMLRVGVKGGGCSGLSYDMSFDREKGEYDKTMGCDGVTLVVDAKSLLYMAGTTIDFSSEILSGGFRFSNPKATRGCGCGTSFSV